MDAQRIQADHTNVDVERGPSHREAISLDGMDDLFRWASDVVAESNPGSVPVTDKDLKPKRDLVESIRKTHELESQQKYGEEISYLQKRCIALMQVLNEKLDETSVLKQIVVAQSYELKRVAELENEVKNLQQMTWYREEAEQERRSLMNALSRLKIERDMLDELLHSNETENSRLAYLLRECRQRLEFLEHRTWWHVVRDLFVPRKRQA